MLHFLLVSRIRNFRCVHNLELQRIGVLDRKCGLRHTCRLATFAQLLNTSCPSCFASKLILLDRIDYIACSFACLTSATANNLLTFHTDKSDLLALLVLVDVTSNALAFFKVDSFHFLISFVVVGSLPYTYSISTTPALCQIHLNNDTQLFRPFVGLKAVVSMLAIVVDHINAQARNDRPCKHQ